NVLGARDQARRLLEGAVRREAHPVGFEIVGCDAGLARCCCHGGLAHGWSMIFSENRCPLFGIMLYLAAEGVRLLPTARIDVARQGPTTNPTSSRRACRAASPTSGRPRSRRRGG